jgi:AbrB family looped-hinge helix DNA binding protein
MLKIKDIVKCDSKGRIVIPKSVRDELGINSGDKFDIVLSEDDLIVLSKKGGKKQEFEI